MSAPVSVRRSLGIVTANRITSFGLGLLSVIVVSRLLTPHEIGIFSVSMAFIGFAHVMREFGVGQYLMQVREITREQRRAAFTVTMAVSWMIAGVLYAIRSPAAAFYGDAGVGEVMALIALNFVTLPFATPLRAQLHRDMQFKKMAVADLSNSVVSALTTIAAAWLGASYLSMAYGSIAGNLAGLAALVLISPRGALDWPTRHGLRDVFRFGAQSSVASFTTEIGTAAPDLILGRTLGFADVAFFSRANGLLSMALGQLKAVVQSVYGPVFARGHREGQDTAEIYSRFSAMLLAVILPGAGMLALLSAPLIEFMFGPHWQRSAPLGSLLCVFSMLTAPVVLAPFSLVASGHVGAMMRCRLACEALRVALLFSSLFCPLELVVALLGLAYLAEAWIFLRALQANLGIDTRALWRAVRSCYLLVPITLALPACALALLQRAGVQSAFAQLAVSGALGLAGWLLGLSLLRHPLHAEVARVWASVRSLRRRGRS